MKIRDILAISGEPGLYLYIAGSRNGVIAESLVDGKRKNFSGTHSRVSSLAEISIFTDDEDVALADVLANLYKHTEGKQTISHKAPEAELRSLFDQVLPTYDRERFHLSDMRKVAQWFNIMVAAGMTDFSLEEPEEEAAEEQTEE
ncbi:MAG: DUF5606 domain-containing protein [Tidjanibacter sp.]|nr:DUF5606 domain-containing protein [Tidjanibacter sp.]